MNHLDLLMDHTRLYFFLQILLLSLTGIKQRERDICKRALIISKLHAVIQKNSVISQCEQILDLMTVNGFVKYA